MFLMISLFYWNARGLGLSNKRSALKELLIRHKIDIVAIQETKKESFPTRQLNALSHTINYWLCKPSIGSSGGILLGINENKFSVIDSWIKEFSVLVLLSNKSENFIWLFTVVYGPVLSSKRIDFLNEIRNISLLGHSSWIIGGDFNLIRSRTEKMGPSYNSMLCNRFNTLISDLNLIDLPLLNRRFT